MQTLMSVDADRLVNLCISFHDLWSLPTQIAIALWLLYTQVGRADLPAHPRLPLRCGCCTPRCGQVSAAARQPALSPCKGVC